MNILSVLSLVTVEGVNSNLDGSVVIQNKIPKAWAGRLFDVGIYKDSRLILTQSNIHIGDQVVFIIKPVLFFGIVRNVSVGQVFTSLEIMSCLQEFELADFPDGMEVILDEEPTGGKYSFSATNKVFI